MDITLGVVGTGHISTALVIGLCSSPAPPRRILVSPRSADNAAKLAARFPGIVSVAASNQAVLDGSDWVVLSIRPQIAREVVADLKFKPGQTVLSLIAPIALDWLDDAVKPGVLASRFLVMPPVERRLGPVAFFPPHAEVEKMMALVGTPVPVRDLHELLVIWSLTALIAPFFNLVATTAGWAARNGVDAETARAYAVSMFESVAIVGASKGAAAPPVLATHAQTKGGLNEQVMKELSGKAWFDHVQTALDGILKRLEGR